MEQLNYRTNDRTFPDEPLQRIFAERFMDLMLPDMTPGKTVMEGLAFDHDEIPVYGEKCRQEFSGKRISRDCTEQKTVQS